MPSTPPSSPGLRAPCPSSVLLALAVLLVAACGEGNGDGAGADGARSPAIRDSAAVRIVENRGEVGRDRPATGTRRVEGEHRDAPVALVPERRVGAREGAAAFGRVAAVDLGPAGELLVLDRQNGVVSAWDAEGRLLRRFGALGDGPGEFRTPAAVRVLDDGRVAVGEAYPPRLSWFGPDGEFLESVRVRPGKGGPPMLAVTGDWRIARSGLARVRLSYMSPSHTAGTPVLVGAPGPEGAVVDTLLTWTSAVTPARLPTLFQADWSWDLAEDGGLVASPGDRYELRLHDPRGRLRRIVRRESPPVPVTPELTDRAVEAFLERFADTDVPAATLVSLRDRLEVAPELPRVQGVHVAEPDGGLWVEVPTSDRTGEVEEAGAWELFDAAGRYRGRVGAPRSFRLHGIRGDRVYGVWTDGLGVEHARVYRIARWDRRGEVSLRRERPGSDPPRGASP